MKETFYFQHDYNARHDPKLLNIRAKYGLAGIGAFWCLIETLYEQGGKVSVKNIVGITNDLQAESEMIESIINDFDLFQVNGEFIQSNSVTKRIEERKSKSESQKAKVQKRWNNSKNQDNNKFGTNSVLPNENSVLPNNTNKGKEKKEKEIYNNSFIDIKESETQVSPKVDLKKVIDLYHSNCPSYPRILKLSDNRKRKIEIRFLDEMKGDWALLESVFEKMEASKFLRGDNSRGWKATFDWLFSNEKNWVKVAEGNYDNRIGNTTNNREDDEKRREQEFLQHIAEKLSRSDVP